MPEQLSRVAVPGARQFVFEADIKDFFGEIDHEMLRSMVGDRVSDRRWLLCRLGGGHGEFQGGQSRCFSQEMLGAVDRASPTPRRY